MIFESNGGARAYEAWLALRGKFLLKCHQGTQFFKLDHKILGYD